MRRIFIDSANNPTTSGGLLEAYRITFKLIWGDYV